MSRNCTPIIHVLWAKTYILLSYKHRQTTISEMWRERERKTMMNNSGNCVKSRIH